MKHTILGLLIGAASGALCIFLLSNYTVTSFKWGFDVLFAGCVLIGLLVGINNDIEHRKQKKQDALDREADAKKYREQLALDLRCAARECKDACQETVGGISPVVSSDEIADNVMSHMSNTLADNVEPCGRSRDLLAK